MGNHESRIDGTTIGVSFLFNNDTPAWTGWRSLDLRIPNTKIIRIQTPSFTTIPLELPGEKKYYVSQSTFSIIERGSHLLLDPRELLDASTLTQEFVDASLLIAIGHH